MTVILLDYNHSGKYRPKQFFQNSRILENLPFDFSLRIKLHNHVFLKKDANISSRETKYFMVENFELLL